MAIIPVEVAYIYVKGVLTHMAWSECVRGVFVNGIAKSHQMPTACMQEIVLANHESVDF